MALDAVSTPEALILRCKIDAPDDLLWSYLSTAAGLACWQADDVRGDLDDGNFSLRWPDLGARLDLSVSEVTRGKRIVLRAGATALELGVQGGEVELIHRGLDSEDDLQGFESSWRTALSLLDLAATKHPRETRSVRWLFEEVPTRAELLHCYFTEAAALSTWLGPARADFSAGEKYQVDLFGGQQMSGTVLYAARDVCLHVQEWSHGALVMRSLPGPRDSRIAALGVSTWESAAPPSVVPALEGALSRLSSTTQSRQS